MIGNIGRRGTAIIAFTALTMGGIAPASAVKSGRALTEEEVRSGKRSQTPEGGNGSVMFGAPKRATAGGELGFSGLPRGAFYYPISPTFAVGGEFILDIGLFNAITGGIPGTITVAAGAPLKFTLMEQDGLQLGATFTPGIGGAFRSGFGSFALLLHSEIAVGFALTPQVSLGGGFEIPFTVLLGDANGVLIPVLLGPIAEFYVIPDLSLFTELKFGPHIAAGETLGFGGSNVEFGFKIQVGAHYSFDL